MCAYHYFFRILYQLDKIVLDKIKIRWWDHNAFKRDDCGDDEGSGGISIYNIGNDKLLEE